MNNIFNEYIMDESLCEIIEYIIDASRKFTEEDLSYYPKFIGGTIHFKSASSYNAFVNFLNSSDYLKKEFNKYFKIMAFDRNNDYKILINTIEHFDKFSEFLNYLEKIILRDKNESYFEN